MTLTADAPEVATTVTRHIPCTIEFAPNLRKTVQEYSPEVTGLHITPGTGEIRAYAGNTIYTFNCTEREGDVGATEKEVIIGLRCYKHSEVPAALINDSAPSHEQYYVHKVEGQLTSNMHPVRA